MEEKDKDTKAALKVPNSLQKNAITILDMISGGADERAICDHFNIRRGTFVQWMITFPQFERAVKEARKQRADSYRSIIHERLYIEDEYGGKQLRQLDKDEVPGEKLIFEKLKWLAEVDNPEKYGTRVKHEGGGVMPVQIVVDTGIQQKEDMTKKKEEDIIEAEIVKDSDGYKDMDF